MSLNISAGDLRTPFQYQAKVRVGQSDLGQPAYEWQALFSGHCLIRPLNARERYYAGGVKEGAAYRIFMRYRPDVKVKGRLVLADGRQVELTSVGDWENRRQFLDCQGA